MMRRTLMILTAILIVATVAQAQNPPRRYVMPHEERAGRWDFSIQTRYSGSKDFTVDGGATVSINSDLGWGFGFGYNINQHFNLGLLFSWRSVPYQATAIDATDPSTTNSYSGQMTTSAFGLSGEYNILKGRFTPYVNGSIGWYHINTNVIAGYTSGCWWDPWWGYVCGSVPLTYGKDTSAYTLGLGGRFEVSDTVFLRAGYEHGWIGAGAADGSDLMRIDIGFMF